MGWFDKLKGKWRDYSGKKYEKKIAMALDKDIEITDFRKKYQIGKEKGETDIETKSSAIEVKKYDAHKLEKQLDKYSRFTKKEPIGFAPKIKPQNEKRVSKKYNVFKDIDSLKSYLVRKGDGKKNKDSFFKNNRRKK